MGKDVFEDDFDGKMSNLNIDCTSKTLTVNLEGSGTKEIVGELYVIENSIKKPHKVNPIIKSLSISADGRDVNYNEVESPYSSNPSFSFLVMPGTKSLTISNLSLIPEPLQKLESGTDSVSKEKVPGWIKNNAKWWAEGSIDENSFVGGIQHLIKEKIIDIPDLPKSSSPESSEKVPGWIKNNAKWWAEGTISESDFVNGIKYLVEHGIVRTS